ncbi:hypothetical protein Tco_1482878 [Tanacetum coccineum]
MTLFKSLSTAKSETSVNEHYRQILPQEVSNFATTVIEKLIKESRDEVTLAKVSSQLQSTYEDASTLTEFELKKILLDKMEKSESYLTTMTYTTSTTKTKAAEYDLPDIEDMVPNIWSPICVMRYLTLKLLMAAKYDLPDIEGMVPNIWSPVKVAYDRYAL